MNFIHTILGHSKNLIQIDTDQSPNSTLLENKLPKPNKTITLLVSKNNNNNNNNNNMYKNKNRSQ